MSTSEFAVDAGVEVQGDEGCVSAGTVEWYNARTERLKAVDGAMTRYMPWGEATVTDPLDQYDDGILEARRELILAGFRALTRLMEES